MPDRALNDRLFQSGDYTHVNEAKKKLFTDASAGYWDGGALYESLATSQDRRVAFNDMLNVAAANPIEDFGFAWKAVFWAEDPDWTAPADGGAVFAWKNGGSTRMEGVYLDPDDGLTVVAGPGYYAQVPDSAVLDITGDITLVSDAVTLADWTPTAGIALCSKVNISVGNPAAYALLLLTDGTLQMYTTADGSTPVTGTSTVPVPFTNGQTGYVAGTLDVNNGAGGRAYTFWTSTDGVTWTQLGSTVTTAGTTSIAVNTSPFYLCGAWANGLYTFMGSVGRVRVLSGATFTSAGPGGTLVLDADCRRSDTNKFTCTTGQTVTVVNLKDACQATGTKQPAYRASVAALNDKPAIQGDGIDDFLQTANWTSALTQPVSVVVVGSVATPGRVLVDGNDTINRILVYTPAGAWGLSAGTLLSGGTRDTDDHLWVAYANGASSALEIDGSTVVSGNAGANSIDGVSLFSLPNGTSNNDGNIAFAGWIAGDVTADANWPAFVAWVESHYGLAVA